MNLNVSQEVTALLGRLRDGDPSAEDSLVCLIYDELRQVASGLMKHERRGHTLQPTALVHEAFLRLRPHLSDVANRRYLFAAAREAMRRVLIDSGRARRARKRTYQAASGTPHAPPAAPDLWSPELIDALEELAALDPRKVEIVEYRYLVGLTVEETSEQLGLSKSTVERQWRIARAWLYERLGNDR